MITDGLTGEFQLENGRRELFNLEVIEINNPDKPIGRWSSENPESIELTRNATQREQELQIRMQNYNFIVSSKLVYYSTILLSIEWQFFIRLGKPYLMESGIEGAVGNARYRGFSMDLITEVAKLMNITFQFVLAHKNLPTSIVDDLMNRVSDYF